MKEKRYFFNSKKEVKKGMQIKAAHDIQLAGAKIPSGTFGKVSHFYPAVKNYKKNNESICVKFDGYKSFVARLWEVIPI